MSEPTRSGPAALLRQAAVELKALQSRLDAAERAQKEPIAVIGVGCRFPGCVVDAASFWRLLRDGVDAIREVPPDRWDIDEYYHPDPRAPGKMNTRWGGFIEGVDRFDPYFFGISPRECAAMDPQQRLFLEVAWEALEDAGQAIDRLRGSTTGVFVGAFGSDYAILQQADPERIDVYGSSGSGCAIAGRLSYLLDLRGPSIAVDTACSSSLTAIHLACHSLRSGESSLAVVGGVNLILSPVSTISLTKIQALAPDGRCKTFDARADGMARGEGCGVVILKRLSDALAAGDPIRAIIRGTAVNQDGASTSFTSPNVLAQQAVIRKAVAAAGVDPAQVSYVEAHGTGTALGDPIEIDALKAVYGAPRSGGPCAIGALKTNMGHLEGAAGIAGFIKVVLSLEHEAIAPNLHFTRLNPHISLDGTPFWLPTELRPWPRGEGSRLGAVSAFGLNGTNAHVILEEAPQKTAVEEAGSRAAQSRVHLLPLSARSPAALEDLARAYVSMLEADPAAPLHDVCYTASLRRAHHEHRLAVVGNGPKAFRERLEAFVRGEPARGLVSGAIEPGRRRGVVFVFSPHGSQWVGMGRALIEEEPVFRAAIEACDERIRREVGWSVIERLTRDEGGWLEQIDVLQPTLFALQVAMAALWRSRGIEPDAVVGHSMGEVAAAHVAGALSLDDAVRITCRRSRLLRKTSGQGAMAVVELSLEAARAEIAGRQDRLAIAVSNSPRSTVLSGDPDALEELLDDLERRGIFCGWGVADVASHSPQMEALAAALVEELGSIAPRTAPVAFYSTVTGVPVGGDELGPSYWIRNLKQTVFFSLAVQRLLDDGLDTFIEISPHPILAPAIEDWLRHLGREGAVLPSMRRDDHERAAMLESLAALYTRGLPVDWRGLHPAGRCTRLPAYPWQRERFWLDQRAAVASAAAAPGRTRRDAASGHPLLGERWEASFPEATHYWKVDLGAEAFPYLADHCIQGSVVVPAVLYLELAVAGARELLGNAAFALERVELKKMLALPAHGSAQLQLVMTLVSQEEAQFRISSRSPGGNGRAHGWTLHALGAVRIGPAASSPAVDLDAIRARCADTIPGAAIHRAAEERGVQFGPTFRGMIALHRRDGEALAHVRLPEPVALTSADYNAHPALLDGCFQALGALGILRQSAAGGDATYLPTGMESFRVHRPAGASVWSHAVLRSAGEGSAGERDTFEGDLVLVGDDGQPVIEVRGVRFKHFDGGGLRDALDDWLYTVAWTPKGLASTAVEKPAEPGRWLIFTDTQGVGQALSELLTARGERCVLAAPGSASGALAPGVHPLDPTRPVDFRQLLEGILTGGGPPLRGVVFLWALDAPGPDQLTQARLQAAEDLVCVGAMHLVQALIHAGFRDMPRLWLVTRGAHAVGDVPRPIAIAQSLLCSLGRTITHEHPELGCGRIDLDPDAPAMHGARALLEQILEDDGEDQIALRSGVRHVARLRRHVAEPMDAAPSNAGTLRADATYLVTGGLSGLGLEIAAWMVAQGARHLVLVSRRGVVPEAQPALDRMAQAGAKVVIERADVTQPQQLEDLFARIDATMPELRGVVHSAVTLDDGILLRQTRDRFRAAAAAKLEGAFLLHGMTLGRPLDFFVLFSSASSLLGAPGDGSYGASNAFVDALAHHRRAMGLPALSINWGPWSDVGLGAAQTNRGERLGFRGVASMTPRQGATLFGRLLGQPAAQVGAMRLDLRQWRQYYPKAAGAPLFAELGAGEGASGQSAAAVAVRLAALREATPEERRERLESLVREQIVEVLRLDPSRITSETPLNTLGFDSLMAVELRNRLELLLGATLPVTLVWGYPTVAALVPHLATKIGVPLEPAAAPEREVITKDDSVLATLLGNVEQLSADAALRMLVGNDGRDK
ncbi:type I polyketide synthase [Polyangium aurulentum]|uniref:type I polyketide synthase n=1 Tax=Polyangium aurulentum TaxID=2567896 RepID=UPI0010AE477E|nr:type I polyketide synthase [Polyangium aurulentum]UQA57009.1 type I polyketide synthase [Polyangium aurulentum]